MQHRIVHLAISYVVSVYLVVIGWSIWEDGGVGLLIGMARGEFIELLFVPALVGMGLLLGPGLWWEGSMALGRMVWLYAVFLGSWAVIYMFLRRSIGVRPDRDDVTSGTR